MNETIDKFLLADNKFMSEMHLLIVLVDHLLKVKKELKIKKKLDIQGIFIKKN